MGRAIRCALAFVIAACHHAPPPVSVGPLPPGAYSHYLAGKMALYRDDLDGAVREMSAAVEAAPEQPMISVELARVLAKAKRDDGARDVLARARKKWPYHAQVWLASGEVLEIGSEKTPALRKEALIAYKRAIDLEPAEERGYLGLARTQEAAGDTRGAEKTLRALVAKKPDSVDGHYRLAQRLDEKGERDAAAKELRAVLEWEPDHLDARMDLAHTLRRQGKFADAVTQARSAFDRAGQPMDLAEELYWLICEADDLQGAIDLLTLLDDDRSDADALATVAQFQRGLGRIAESRVVAEHIKPLDADESVIALAEADISDGKTKEAIDRLQTIGVASARYLESRRVLVNAYLAAHDPAKALAVITPLRAEKPAQLDLAFAEALTRAEAGETAAAKTLAAGFKGEDMPVAYLRARILDKLGDYKGALAVLEPALVKSPDHVSGLNLAGYLLAQHKERLGDAERYLAHARDLQPGDPSVLDSWGNLLLQRGKSRDAVRALDHAARFAPHEAEILVHLAEAWAADGAPKHAAEILDRAAALKPPSDVIRRIDAIRATLAIR
ncbi:MAG TPA: tetratricopeptide repeat protein [Kofleriaceae bacterium]|nr:tetratricopeptide repeat protein [Kofleriaceae bacterium]